MRPTKLPDPLKGMVDVAGSDTALRHLMGDIPATTLRRWGALIHAGKPLPRTATTAIRQAHVALATTQKENS